MIKVIAIQWSEKDKKCMPFVIGYFGDFINAKIFQKAYNKKYHAKAWIEIENVK